MSVSNLFIIDITYLPVWNHHSLVVIHYYSFLSSVLRHTIFNAFFFQRRVHFYLHKAIFALPYVLNNSIVQQAGHYGIVTVYPYTIHVR